VLDSARIVLINYALNIMTHIIRRFMEIVRTIKWSGVPSGYGYKEVERAVGKCNCGKEVPLIYHTNKCACGQRYNIFGQKVNKSELG
jgi:hypothetical protein